MRTWQKKISIAKIKSSESDLGMAVVFPNHPFPLVSSELINQSSKLIIVTVVIRVEK